MGEGPTRKFGLLQDLILIAVAVSPLLDAMFRSRRSLLTRLQPQNISVYYLAKQIISSLPLSGHDTEKEQHEQAQIKAAANLRRLNLQNDESSSESNHGREGSKRAPRGPRKEDLVLNHYENQIAMEVVAPEDIPVGFEGKVQQRSRTRRLLTV
jgi:ATPase family AAA domain-containing protein 1